MSTTLQEQREYIENINQSIARLQCLKDIALRQLDLSLKECWGEEPSTISKSWRSPLKPINPWKTKII